MAGTLSIGRVTQFPISSVNSRCWDSPTDDCTGANQLGFNTLENPVTTIAFHPNLHLVVQFNVRSGCSRGKLQSFFPCDMPFKV
jgi:hypothetical protein